MEGSAKVVKFIIAISFLLAIFSCASDTGMRKRILEDNPDCWYEENGELNCPLPFANEEDLLFWFACDNKETDCD